MHLHHLVDTLLLSSLSLTTLSLLLPTATAFSSPNTNPIMTNAAVASSLPPRVDYLVIGGGATAMAFCDSLLRNHHKSSSSSSPSVVMVDNHKAPGGQWNDSYEFVRLHQPSDMYGVESTKLELLPGDESNKKEEEEAHRATREEILKYYDNVRASLEKEYDFHFV
eukprot:scaffold79749_cov24-Cyclotella_meneghiniana.AAC.1